MIIVAGVGAEEDAHRDEREAAWSLLEEKLLTGSISRRLKSYTALGRRGTCCGGLGRAAEKKERDSARVWGERGGRG
jgi:hypothetical protein